MTDRELERRLEHALSQCAPDDLEGVLSRCQTRKGTVIPMTVKTPKRAVRNLIAACLALVLVGGGGAGYYYKTVNAVASIVSLDVNPSIELKVNKNEKVLSAAPLNEDAVVILEDMDLKGANVEVAMNAIIGSLLQHGYVDELANSILITVEDEDTQRGEKLQQELTAQANAALANAQVNGAILAQTFQHSDTLAQLAEEYGISAGKAALIQTIVEGSREPKTFEELVGLSINELNLIYTSMTNNTAQSGEELPDPSQETASGGASSSADQYTSTIQTSGKASQSAYIGAEAAKTAALSHAGLNASQVTALEIDYDWEDGRMVYEIEFRTASQEYECEVDALTGEIIKYETEHMGGGHADIPASSSSSSASSGSAPAADIGEAAAKTAALKHAGVSEENASFTKVERDYDDGRLEYEIEFWAGSTEYDYTIAGADGAVLGYDTERHGSESSSASSTDIGAEAAKAAALKHAGVNAADTYEMEVDRDYDDGRLEYSVEFKAGGKEYEYTVDGSSGAILEYESDWD